MRAGGNRNRLGAQVDAVRIGRAHPAIDVEQRGARTINRDLDLLRRLCGMQRGAAVAVQRSGGLVIEGHAEAVLAVRRERVQDRDAAARAVRRALDMLPLRGPPRHRVGRLARRRRGVADRETADFGGRRQVALHQRRRQQLRVGDVVEVRALRVERQVIAGVDVEREQVAHRALILRAVEALEGAAAGDDIGARARPPRARARRPARRARLRPGAGCRAAASAPRAACGSSSRPSRRARRRSARRRIAATARRLRVRSLWQPMQVRVMVCGAASRLSGLGRPPAPVAPVR